MNYTSNDSVPQTKKRQFTPVFDDIAAEHGAIAALVYGAIWRRTKMRRSVCDAAHQTMADSIDLSVRAFRGHLKSLIGAGVVVDLTDGKRGKTRSYGVVETMQEMQPIHAAGAAVTPESLHEMQHTHAADADKDTTKETRKEKKQQQHSVEAENNAAFADVDSSPDVDVADSFSFSNHQKQTATEPSQPASESVAVEDENIPAGDLEWALGIIADNGGGRIGRTKAVKESAAGFIELARKLDDGDELHIPENIFNPAAYIITQTSAGDTQALLESQYTGIKRSCPSKDGSNILQYAVFPRSNNTFMVFKSQVRLAAPDGEVVFMLQEYLKNNSYTQQEADEAFGDFLKKIAVYETSLGNTIQFVDGEPNTEPERDTENGRKRWFTEGELESYFSYRDPATINQRLKQAPRVAGEF